MVTVTAASEIDDASDGEGERLFVNKQELAQKILEVSVPTVNAIINRYPDLPIEQRGTNGLAWRFDACAVVKFLQDKRAEARRAGAGRETLFEQLKLSLDEMDAPEASGFSPAQRLALPEPVGSAADLLIYQVLLRDREAISDLVRTVLMPLGRARGGAAPLLSTLAAYFACGGVAAAAARQLHLSVRAVTYRLARVRELTGRDPAQPADALILQVAVIGAQLLDWPATPLDPG